MEELKERMLKLEEEASEDHKLELKIADVLYKIEYLIVSTRYIRSPEKKERHTMEVVKKHNEKKKDIIEDTLQKLMNEKLYDKK